MTIETSSPPASSPASQDEQALFPEARRLRRRRWTIGTLGVVGVLGAIAVIVAVTSASGGRRDAQAARSAGVLPNGQFATLKVAGPLAVAPDGALYVADVASDRVLVRLRDGRFRVVAGSGKVGLSGDGGPALRAELSDVSDLAFAPNGTLYIADGGRVRVVGRGGIIRTIIGKMRTNPLSIAISPSGQLYISTSATPSASSQILRLTGRDTLATVRPVVLFGPLRGQRLDSFGPIAIDARGTIDIAGFNGWSTWRVAPGGDAREVGPGSGARRSGGGYSVLERAPNGAVYAENGSTLLRLSDLSLVPTFTFRNDFWLTYFAFAPSGAIYADEIPGNTGFEDHQQLLFVSHGHTSLLWQESNRAPK